MSEVVDYSDVSEIDRSSATWDLCPFLSDRDPLTYMVVGKEVSDAVHSYHDIE